MASNGIPPYDEDKQPLDSVEEAEQIKDIKLNEIDGLDNSDFGTDTLEFETISRRPRHRENRIKLVMILLIIAGAGYFVWMQWGDLINMSAGNNNIPIVRALDKPFKVRPVKPGGKDFPNRDKLVYDRLERKAPQKKSENLLPRPELPLLPSSVERASSSDLTVQAKNLNSPPQSIGKQPTTEEVKAVEKPSIDATAPQIKKLQDNRILNTDPIRKKIKPVSKLVVPNSQRIDSKNQPVKSFQIQLAAVRNASNAKKEWKRLRAQNMSLLGNLKLSVVRANLGAQGIFFRLRAGPIKTRVRAREMCRSLGKVNVGCLVIAP